MDFKDDVLELLELLWRLGLSQDGDSNVATQFVRNGHCLRGSVEIFQGFLKSRHRSLPVLR